MTETKIGRAIPTNLVHQTELLLVEGRLNFGLITEASVVYYLVMALSYTPQKFLIFRQLVSAVSFGQNEEWRSGPPGAQRRFTGSLKTVRIMRGGAEPHGDGRRRSPRHFE